MNAVSSRGLMRVNWSATILFTLGFWLSGSLVIDSVIIPGLLATGMMAESGFASAGYVIFGIFNHIELLCGALVLTGCLVLKRNHQLPVQKEQWSIIFSALLLTIAIIYTYILTPQMSSLGLQLNWFEPSTTMPLAMVQMHGSYWFLEVTKFLVGASLLRWFYRNSCALI